MTINAPPHTHLHKTCDRYCTIQLLNFHDGKNHDIHPRVDYASPASPGLLWIHGQSVRPLAIKAIMSKLSECCYESILGIASVVGT